MNLFSKAGVYLLHRSFSGVFETFTEHLPLTLSMLSEVSCVFLLHFLEGFGSKRKVKLDNDEVIHTGAKLIFWLLRSPCISQAQPTCWQFYCLHRFGHSSWQELIPL